MTDIASRTVPSAPLPSLGRLLATPLAARALFVALFALVLVPVLVTPIPAMVDYVNHLARMYELSAQGTPLASPFYHADWKLYPNLAMDLMVPLLARWTGVEMATRLFLLASQILVVTGSMAIERGVKGRFAISGYVAVLYLFNVPFAWGFLNFEFALGFALWGIAAWLAVGDRRWPTRLAVHALFVVALFAAHLFALGLYGVTLGIDEAWRARRADRPLRWLIASAFLLGAPVAIIAIVMLAMGGSVGGSGNAWFFSVKALWPFLLLNGDSAVLSILGTLCLAGLLRAMVRRGELAFVGPGAWLAAGFAGLYLVVPSRFLDTAFVDIRVLVGAVMILPAFVSVTFADARRARLAAAVVAGVTIANVACVTAVWSAYQPVYRAMIASFDKIAPRARVLVAYAGRVDDPPLLHLADYPLYHAPTLAVHYRGAFVPTLFATAGKQPLTVAPGLERLSFSCGGPVAVETLRGVAAGVPEAAAGLAFVQNWTRDFDDVYVLGRAVTDPMPGILDLVERQPTFSLYRVRKPQLAARP